LEKTVRDEPTPHTIIGRSFTFLIAPTNAQTALGPAWAVLCGALASGNWQWQVDRLRNLILALFIAELLWSTWRAILIDMDWPTFAASHPLPEHGDAMLVPPYTTPWSPVGRLFVAWARLRRWMRQTLPVERSGMLLALPILPPVVIVLSAAISAQILLLSIAVLALTAVEWYVARRKRAHYGLQAGSEIGASWLAGHLVFSQLTWQTLTLACCYALVYQGALYLTNNELGAARRSWALALIYAGQIAAMALLVALGHQLAAMVLGLLGMPQLLLLAQLDSDAHNLWYLRHAAPFLVVSMLVAAWAI
jgi:hypothetical protein